MPPISSLLNVTCGILLSLTSGLSAVVVASKDDLKRVVEVWAVNVVSKHREEQQRMAVLFADPRWGGVSDLADDAAQSDLAYRVWPIVKETLPQGLTSIDRSALTSTEKQQVSVAEVSKVGLTNGLAALRNHRDWIGSDGYLDMVRVAHQERTSFQWVKDGTVPGRQQLRLASWWIADLEQNLLPAAELAVVKALQQARLAALLPDIANFGDVVIVSGASNDLIFTDALGKLRVTVPTATVDQFLGTVIPLRGMFDPTDLQTLTPLNVGSALSLIHI